MLGRKKSRPAEGPKLRIWPAALEGYRFTVRNAGTALRLTLLPALCLTGVHFALFGFEPPSEDPEAALGVVLAGLGEVSAMILLIAMVLVAWQRRILLGQGNAKMRLGRREGRMLIALLLLGLLVALVNAAVILLAIGSAAAGAEAAIRVLDVAAKLATAYLTGRFYFMLPPRAMDRKLSLAESWRMSAGHGRDLMAIVVLVGVPVVILSNVAAQAAATALENGAVAMLAGANLFGNFLLMLGIVVEAAAMTFCYAALGGYAHILEARGIEAESKEQPEAAPA